ncbi:hypothetical protein C4D60_Mb09t04080 [Musa balbisiana]|uniref:DUF3741 domain-containing protein n=1 Tax=Musa balbisiana TaxID=52838 RepID=A0A4V4H2Z8_MUSBA|nr:hypothetical protein C4D60_Mb09t04080 [Musa balbisiana]
MADTRERTHVDPTEPPFSQPRTAFPSHHPTHCVFKRRARPSRAAFPPPHSNLCLSSPLPPLMNTSHPPLDLNSDAAGVGCLSGVVRRLLCASLRSNVHGDCSADDGVGSSSLGTEWIVMQKKKKKKPPATPCIVARLMGLDSMPVFPYTPPETVTHSRSTNSVESWPGFLCSERSSGAAQIRTPSSFREAPTYLRQENDDFLVMSFTPEDKARSIMVKAGDSRERKKGGKNNGTKKETRRTEQRSRVAGKQIQKENVPQRKHSSGKGSAMSSPNKACRTTKSGGSNIKPAKQKETPLTDERGRRKSRAGCSSLSFNSPHSGNSITGSLFPSANAEDERKQTSKLEKLNYTSPSCHPETTSRDRGTDLSSEPRTKKSSKAELASLEWSQIWEKTCLLTEEDLRDSTWTSREIWRSVEAGEIGAVVALEMLDLVLMETVSQMSSNAKRSKNVNGI